MPVTVITGASSGIGFELAKYAAQEGHLLIINARRKVNLEELQKLNSEKIIIVDGDISQKDIQDQVVREVQKIGHLDYLFNNAGVGWMGLLEKQTNIREMLNLNVTALIELTHKLIPYLKKSPSGRILNIASVVGRIEVPHMSTYVASKHAVVGFSRALNIELANTNITVSAVCPTGVKTEFTKIAVGESREQKANSFAEPVERVAASIWKNKHIAGEIFYPTFLAWLTVFLSKLFRPFMVLALKGIVRKKGENYF